MSAKRKSNQSNTLFSYFSSPKQSKKAPTEEVTKNKKPENGFSKKADGCEEEDDVLKIKKRNRSCIFDSDSENDEPTASESATKKPKKQKPDFFSDEENNANSDQSLLVGQNSILDQFEFEKTECNPSESVDKNIVKDKKKENKNQEDEEKEITWAHEKLSFLKPNNIKDAQKRSRSDPNYDHHTLYVPEDFLQNQTPAMRQWWVLKSQHFDTVLFFKVGKFYELYHMDADVGVQELGFTFMRGEFAHSGFPESAYGKMAQALVNKGYKVARVEQTETPDMMAERCKQSKKLTKFDKVVAREICQVSTKGTCIYGAQLSEPQSEMGSYMYSIAAKVNSDGTCRIGVSFIDTSIGTFHLSEFEDDKQFSRLLCLFSEYPPGLILTERGANYGQFKQLLTSSFKDVKQDTLASKTQFCSAGATLEKLASECYFKNKDGHFQWPDTFKQLADDCLPKPEYELTLKALGGALWFLKDSLLDIQLFSIGKFVISNPVDLSTEKKDKINQDYMVLDTITISNLNLLGGQGTLQRTIDCCSTAFGKRLLQQWICRPLCNVEKIRLRHEAVKELFENTQLLNSAQDILKKLPDLERQVAKIHHYGNRFCSTNHPDGRAIFYEANIYSKRKICDLLDTLDGFLNAQEIAPIFSNCQSRLLRKITQYAPNGMYVDMRNGLKFFKKSFDYEKVKKEGTMIPKQGVDEDYDEVLKNIKEINDELEVYLRKQSKFFGCQVVYFGNEKKRYQLEVPENRCSRANSEYKLEGTKKGTRRYTTEETREFLQRMMAAESEKNKIILDINRRMFEKFSQNYEEWREIIHCLTMLDVLCSFAAYARRFSQDICTPNVKDFSDNPYFTLENARHPCVANIDTFVPNDVILGKENLSNLMILTGPNMGGKSTLMRQIAIIAIMAQMGAYVPASACSFTLIDRIFTRLGASDDIVQGQSTFFVELTEASTILRHASKQSLLIVDELGRGTSTHDGNAIATAYVQKLSEIKCRTLFSTHYHNLVDHFIDDKKVQLAHMACMVENDDNPTEESVTLLYKVMEGRCPKSFGFNAAKLGGLPNNVVARARILAKQIENEDKNRQIFRQAFCDGVDVINIRNMLAHLNV